MNAQSFRLVAIVVVLLAIGVYQCIDWITPPSIQIVPQIRPPRNGQEESDLYQVTFELDKKYQLTSVKVDSVAALATNKNASPVWQLTTQSNSAPQKGFLYGMNIPGMRPAPGLANQPLLPAQEYRLLVVAGRSKGEVRFKMPALPGM
jgi:hypothetical protein